jgi:DNA-binding MarR family transcriptional regulator
MYKVVTIITPIDYLNNYTATLQRLSHEHGADLTTLYIDILGALKCATKGLRNSAIIRAIGYRPYDPRFANALTRLTKLGYIARTQYKMSVFYNITMQGQALLSELNDQLTEIVRKQKGQQ